MARLLPYWTSSVRPVDEDSLPLNSPLGSPSSTIERHDSRPRWLEPTQQAQKWFYKLIPFCIAAPLGLTERKLPKVASTNYLNGVRGVACWVVLNHHLSDSYAPYIYRGFGMEPYTENHYFFQLPLIRAVHTGKGMVCIFFALSGFVLSYSALRKVNSKSGPAVSDELLTSFASSILRRGIRLFAPMLALVFIQAIVCRYVPFASDYDVSAPTLLAHFAHFWHQALLVLNPFDWVRSGHMPDHFAMCWTLAIEYRMSLAVFLMLIATCRLRTLHRKLLIVCFMCWANYVDQRWDIICFFGGILVAEVRFAPLSTDIGRILGKPEFRPNPWISTVFGAIACVVGVIFCSIPEVHPELAFPYNTFYWMMPKIFEGDDIGPSAGWIWYWGSIGAVLLIWGLEQLPVLQRFLALPPISYLGEISYSFYLFQRMARTTVGEPIYKYVHEQLEWNHVPAFIACYVAAHLSCIVVSDYFWRAVDLNCVALARKVVVDWMGVGRKADVGMPVYVPVPAQDNMDERPMDHHNTELPMNEIEPKARPE